MQIVIGDLVGISQPSVSRIIKRISYAIAALRPQYVKFPESMEETRRNFKKIANFPGVFGALDCTHVAVLSPGSQRAKIYRNRKGYFSINVQVICNADLIITDIVSQWPRSAHNATIFANRKINARFEAGEFKASFLLGDSGYPCKSFLMTP